MCDVSYLCLTFSNTTGIKISAVIFLNTFQIYIKPAGNTEGFQQASATKVVAIRLKLMLQKQTVISLVDIADFSKYVAQYILSTSI
jgi:hypothetical protein